MRAFMASFLRFCRTPVRWRFLLPAGLLLIGLAVALAWPRPIFLKLSGTPETMGREQGAACRWRIRALEHFYLKDEICGNDPKLTAAKLASARRVAENADPRQKQELEALAKAAGVDSGMLWIGNCLMDIGDGHAACRAVVWTPRDNGPLLHAHNLDWYSLSGLAPWSITVFRRAPADGRFRTVAIGVPGMIGALDIINEHGIALSVNLLGTGRGTAREPSFMMLRRVAETCSTFEQARSELLKASPDMPFLVTLSSAKEHLSAAFETFSLQQVVCERGPDNGVLISENCHYCDPHGKLIPPDSQVFLAATAASAAPRTPAAMQKLLASSAVMQSINIYSVIFDWQNNRFYLAAVHIPAAQAGYRELPLF